MEDITANFLLKFPECKAFILFGLHPCTIPNGYDESSFYLFMSIINRKKVLPIAGSPP